MGENKMTKAYDEICKADIVELKSFKRPPVAVGKVTGAISVILGNKSDWASALKTSDPNFLNHLKKLKEGSIPLSNKQLAEAHELIDDLNADQVKQQSAAACSLFLLIRYHIGEAITEPSGKYEK